MPQRAEQGPANKPSGGQGLPEEQGGLLDHFLGPLDGNSFLSKAISHGEIRRRDILVAIFSRCRQEGACLIWQGPHSGTGRGGGYGRFSFEGVTSSVHRTVYALIYGPIPPKKQVDHSCNNRLCCNPFHLNHMTHRKNQRLRDLRSSNKP